ncbi:MAG: ECF-type sigma factor [Vicinamibacterales bacterium]
MNRSTPEITDLLIAWSDGRLDARDALAESVQAELPKLARAYMRRERAQHTLQPTALVNEAYIRLIDQQRVKWRNRAHFYGIAAQCMRRVLLDYGRQHRAGKRDAGKMVPFDDALAKPAAEPATFGRLAEALDGLARLDPRQAKVVELRVFAGLSIEEVATLLDVSPGTVKRDWVTAKLWLKHDLHQERAL